jgi:iron-sulfur cluster repair protein YtfE (RIC family)
MPGEGSQLRGEAGVFERWWREHSELDQLVTELDAALRDGSGARARESLDDLTEAFRSHLAIEEEVYFPLLEGLLPEQAAGIRSARLAHRELLGALDEMVEQVAQADLPTARATLDVLLQRFRDHEQEEARMVAKLRVSPRS